jgi:oxygen tolerance protein BatD
VSGRDVGRAWAAVVVLAASAALARAADEPVVRAEVDAARVGVADQVQFTITVEGRSAELAEVIPLPALKNLRLVGGPSVSQQISVVNGALSQSRAYTYVLQPIAAGEAEIGAVEVKLTSGVKKTAALRVEVVAGQVKPRAARPTDPFDGAFGRDPFESFFGRRRPRAEPKVKVVATASRARLHVGEPVLVAYFVYTQVSLSDVQLAEAPQYPGFWAEDVEGAKGGPRGERVTLDGESYVRFPIARKLLFPTRAGRLTIPAARFRVGLARESFFDAGPGRVERATDPLAFEVAALPSAPGFSGAVGDFSVKATLDRTTVPLGEAATLRYTVSGRGNLKWIDAAPALALPGAQVYPPQSKSELTVGPEGISGSRTWEFVVVPQTSGPLSIPSLPFAYFRPSTRTLERTQSAPLTLQVEGAALAAAGPAGPAVPVASAAARGLALRSDLDAAGAGWPAPAPRSVLVMLGLLLAAHAAIAGAARLSDRRRRAAGRPAQRRDVRGALGDLERVRRGRLGKEEASALIERTLHGVFGPAVENGGTSAGDRDQAIRDVLQQVQFIRYAPQLGDYSEAIRDVAARAEEVVRKWA